MSQKSQNKLKRDDIDISLTHNWITTEDANILLKQLMKLPMIREKIKIFGKWIEVPRKVLWIADPEIVYTYSHNTHQPTPWPEFLLPLRHRLHKETEQDYNGVLLNYYESGAEYMGWHSDDEPELGPKPVICSLSVGADRRFLFRHRKTGEKNELRLTHGSLLIMKGETQTHWQHSLPKMMRVKEQRLNLTFRSLRPCPS